VTDDAGVASLTVPGGFTGFYQLERDGDVPAYLYPGARLLAGQPKVRIPATMTTEANFMALQAVFGNGSNTTDAGLQSLAVTQFDCLDKHAAGVAFTSSPPATQTLYLGAGGVPSLGATATLAISGLGVLANVPAGGATVTSTLAAADGGAGGVLSMANVVIHAGSITLVYLRPRTR
jgi:hypothetical protein